MDRLNGCERLTRPKEVACIGCGMYGLCQVAGLDEVDSAKLDSLVERRKKILRGDVLVHAGETSGSRLFAVKSGMFKSVAYFEDDREQVIDFHLPGELIGLEALGQCCYAHTVIALENSSVCDMDMKAMQALPQQYAAFQQNLIQAMGRKIRLSQFQSLQLGTQNADQRLAMFLLNIAVRFQDHGMSSECFRLSMLRRDIANYLGLALETVGRVFKRFEQQGLLKTRGRYTQLIDIRALHHIAGDMDKTAVSYVA